MPKLEESLCPRYQTNSLQIECMVLLSTYFWKSSYKFCMSHLSRILASSALLLHHLFHHPADSPREAGRETVPGQVWTSVGHLLPACPLQDLPLHILREKTDKAGQNCNTMSFCLHTNSNSFKMKIRTFISPCFCSLCRALGFCKILFFFFFKSTVF